MTHIVRWFPAAIGAILLVAGCAPLAPQPAPVAACPPAPLCPACPKRPEPAKPPSTEARYEEKSFAELPGWTLAALEPSLRAFVAGCPRLDGAPGLARACAAARSIAAGDEPAARAFFESAFAPYAVFSPEGLDEGLITGYYEPILSGSRRAGAKYRYPLFGVPDDLVVVDLANIQPELKNLRLRGRLEGRRLVPYYSRAEIEDRARAASGDRARNAGRQAALPAPVIAWVADPVELFFLQIQGSGQIQLDSGERIRVGYADQNGHPYGSLGRYLIERGELPLEQASMQGIKAWAEANPGKLQGALNSNASYVFFRELPPTDGPLGALGAPLSAGYSIAVDRRYVPLGAPVFLATTWPLSERPLERLMAAQDTGGAIRGAVRADFFWGTGADAGALAGRMRQRGRLWILWPRGEPLPRLQGTSG